MQLAQAPNYPEAYGDRRLIRFLRQHKSEEGRQGRRVASGGEAEKIDLIRDAMLAGKDGAGDVSRPVRSSRPGVRSYLVLNNYLM